VLAAVAGSGWVQTLIASTADDPTRLADRPDDVCAALHQLWGHRWSHLADALAEPFRPEALSGDDPWAAAWLDRVRAACTAAPAVPALPTPEAVPVEEPPDVGCWATTIGEIRDEVRAAPLPNHLKPAQVRKVVADRATAAARTAALRRLMWVTALIVAIPTALLVGLLVH